MERFWKKVNKTDTCWLWVGGKSHGYGYFHEGERLIRAHRYLWECLYGKIPDKLHLDHLCRVKNCVNPKHLEMVSNKENTLRGTGPTAINSKKTHCSKGHEYNDQNIYRIPSRPTYRYCRICMKNHHKER